MPEPRFDVTTLGEMLLRLSVSSGERLENAHQLDMQPAGAETNVVTWLARLQRKISWTGALPNHPLGRLAGVDTNKVIWTETGRMGTYYVEFGEPPRGIQVTYDRSHSCATQLNPNDLDWDILLNTRLLHLTGITPALSTSCREIITQAIWRAKEHNIPISFDVNYRQKLWSEVDARQTLLPLIQNVEILFCSQADAKRLFNCGGSVQEIAQGMLELTQARYVTVTFGEQGALLWDGKEWQQEPSRATHIVDRWGAGDALAAGAIQGWMGICPRACVMGSP
jgi:2-dehydro-3-deoxygluconokinase